MPCFANPLTTLSYCLLAPSCSSTTLPRICSYPPNAFMACLLKCPPPYCSITGANTPNIFFGTCNI